MESPQNNVNYDFKVLYNSKTLLAVRNKFINTFMYIIELIKSYNVKNNCLMTLKFSLIFDISVKFLEMLSFRSLSHFVQ